MGLFHVYYGILKDIVGEGFIKANPDRIQGLPVTNWLLNQPNFFLLHYHLR